MEINKMCSDVGENKVKDIRNTGGAVGMILK